MKAENNLVTQATPQEHVESHDPRLESDSTLDLSIPTAEQTLYQNVLRDHVKRIVKEFSKNSPIDSLSNEFETIFICNLYTERKKWLEKQYSHYI